MLPKSSLRVAAGQCLPNGPITQLSLYLTQNPGTIIISRTLPLYANPYTLSLDVIYGWSLGSLDLGLLLLDEGGAARRRPPGLAGDDAPDGALVVLGGVVVHKVLTSQLRFTDWT